MQDGLIACGIFEQSLPAPVERHPPQDETSAYVSMLPTIIRISIQYPPPKNTKQYLPFLVTSRDAVNFDGARNKRVRAEGVVPVANDVALGLVITPAAMRLRGRLRWRWRRVRRLVRCAALARLLPSVVLWARRSGRVRVLWYAAALAVMPVPCCKRNC